LDSVETVLVDCETTSLERDENRARQCLAELETAARSDDANLMVPVIDAVRSYCSLGEICNILRAVFGEYKGRQW
jgi:methylmalonyl-CoA mutase N-terminal domain/subunit